EALVRAAWEALPPFDRAILALYAGRACEHDATVALSKRTGIQIAEFVSRTRRAGVVADSEPDATAGCRGGRRGRQGTLAEILGVAPGRIHQWTCRARNSFLGELRRRCSEESRAVLPPILERVLG